MWIFQHFPKIHTKLLRNSAKWAMRALCVLLQHCQRLSKDMQWHSTSIVLQPRSKKLPVFLPVAYCRYRSLGHLNLRQLMLEVSQHSGYELGMEYQICPQTNNRREDRK